jgi:hypothetical protein
MNTKINNHHCRSCIFCVPVYSDKLSEKKIKKGECQKYKRMIDRNTIQKKCGFYNSKYCSEKE